MLQWFFIILPIVAIIGWWVGRRNLATPGTEHNTITRDYLQGINYLLNEQADKAVELFIKMLTVDSDTVETHLALGNLFRRRGEVDRAIRIHQNLIARPQLAKSHRIQSLVALGRDYMLAGVLDRAERLFLEVIESGVYVNESLKYLLDIYQQEKDWEQAIVIAHRLENSSAALMHKEIAHYYCELAVDARVKVSSEKAMRFLKRAFASDRQCVRASLLLGQWEMSAGNYRHALKVFQKIKNQDIDFLPEAIPALLTCARELNQESDLVQFLQQCLDEYPSVSIMLMLAERLQQWHSVDAAYDFISSQLQKQSSLRGLQRLIELQSNMADGNEKQKLIFLDEVLSQLLINKPIYQCTNCGYAGKVLHWSCPSCKLWNTVKPISETDNE